MLIRFGGFGFALCAPLLCLAQGYTISTVAGGNPLITGIGDNGPAVNCFLNGPGGIALDSAGNLYIADTGDQLVRKVNASTGIITTVAGTNGQPGFSGDGGKATSAKLHGPSGLAVDKAGNLYISDTINNRVRKVDTNGIITTYAGNSTVLTSGVGDGGPATNANLNTPKGLAVDSAGNLYIADFGNYRVREVMASNGTITTVAGNGYNSVTSGSFGEGGPALSAPVSPYNLALDGSNNIYIADSQDNLIRKVTVSTGIITTPAGNSYAGYGANGSAAVMASLNTPQGITVDSAGNLFIADTGNLVIREVTASNGQINDIAGMQAVQGSGGDGGLALMGTLTDPSALALTSTGQLYIADTSQTGYQDGRIRLLAPALPAPTISSGGVVPIFSSATTVEQGSWISIYGTNFASTTSVWAGDFPTSLGGVTSVTIDSQPAFISVVTPTQINVQVPNDANTGSVPVTVTTVSGAATGSVTLGAYGPSFSLLNNKYPAALVVTSPNGGNTGAGYDLIGPAGAFPYATRPVKAGETVVLYGVGFGPTSPPLSAGLPVSVPSMSVTLPKITIGGMPATVKYGGIIEAGLFQFNVVVPSAGTGDQPLVATIGGVSTPTGIFLTLQ